MALLDIYNLLYEDSTLKARIIGASFLAAVNIELEDPGTPDHAARLALAQSILDDPRVGMIAFLKHVAANPEVQTKAADATDNDLQFIVNSTWDSASKAAVAKKETAVAEAAAVAAALKP